MNKNNGETNKRNNDSGKHDKNQQQRVGIVPREALRSPTQQRNKALKVRKQ